MILFAEFSALNTARYKYQQFSNWTFQYSIKLFFHFMCILIKLFVYFYVIKLHYNHKTDLHMKFKK